MTVWVFLPMLRAMKVEFMRVSDGAKAEDYVGSSIRGGDEGVLIQAVFTPEDNHDRRMISEALGVDFHGDVWVQRWTSHKVSPKPPTTKTNG